MLQKNVQWFLWHEWNRELCICSLLILVTKVNTLNNTSCEKTAKLMSFIHYYFWRNFDFQTQGIAIIVYSKMVWRLFLKWICFFSFYSQRKFFKELDCSPPTAWQLYNQYYFKIHVVLYYSATHMVRKTYYDW